jgi:hypothetical protein
MLWRSGTRNEDEPGWREKLAEWRDNPPVILARPDWLSESPGTLFLLFAGVGCLIVAAVYTVVPPESLPANMPGYFSVQQARADFLSSTTTSTTTTTIPADVLRKRAYEIKSWSIERQLEFWEYVKQVGAYEKEEAEAAQLLSKPAEPPTRRWSYIYLAGVMAACLLALAWWMSDARARRYWSP